MAFPNNIPTLADALSAYFLSRRGTNTMRGNVVPDTANLYDIGTASTPLRAIYVQNLSYSGSFTTHSHATDGQGGQLDWDSIWSDAVHDHSSNAEGGTALSGISITSGTITGITDLAVADGGTGLSSYAVGDILYASATTTIAKLADVAVGSYLRSGGVTTAPLWSTLVLPNAATDHRLLVATATNTVGELAASGAAGQYLAGATTDIPAWATLNQAAVAGLTTGDSPTFAGLTLTADLTVANGGTGVSTLTDGGLLVGAGTAAIEAVAVGLTTQILVGGGAATNPAWGTDIPTAVTIGTKYIYRAEGTNVAVADGGTNLDAGTSGGILGYTATGVLASSVLLTASALVLGGGADATPTPLGSLGTTTTLLHGNAAGAPSWAAVNLANDVTGNLAIASLAAGTAQYQFIVTGAAATYTPAWSTGFLNITGTKTLSVELDSVLNQDLTTDAGPSFDHIHSTIATGTAPLVVASTTVVTNLNTDMVDAMHGVGTAQYQIPISGASPFTGAWTLISTLAGAGLTEANGILAVGAGLGITVNVDDVALTTPGTLTVSSTNSATGSHTHAITSSANPGAAASILASDASGNLGLVDLTLSGGDLIAATATTWNVLNTVATTVNVFGAATTVNLGAASMILNVGNTSSLRAASYASQTTGWQVTGAGNADFRYLYTDELHAKSFVADIEQALAGGQIICKSVTKVATDFTLPAAGASGSLVVEELAGFTGQVFVDADLIRLRQITRAVDTSLTIADGWGTVVYVSRDGTANPPTQTYTFTRSAVPNAGTGSGTVLANTLALDYGTAANSYGYHEISAVDGAYGVNAPYAQTVTWATHPAVQANRTVRTRIGNLKGITNALEYGLYAGNVVDGGTLATTNRYIRLSDTTFSLNNLDLSIYNGGAKVISMDYTTPYFSIGNPAPTSYLGATGYWVGNVSGTYKSHLGSISGGALTKGYSWDGTNFSIIGNLTIAPSGANLNYGVNVGEALLLAHYDGPRPYETDYSGNANGHRGQVATKSGGVIFRPGKFGKAVQIAEATTNLHTHPSSEAAVIFDTGVVAGTGSVASSSEQVYIGTNSDKLISTSNATIRSATAGIATNTLLTFSLYIYNPNAITAEFRVFAANPYAAGTGETAVSITSIGNSGWQRVVIANVYSSSANPWIDIRFSANGTLYVDALQVETKAYASCYADGDLSGSGATAINGNAINGHCWTGARNASTSSRTQATLEYPTAGNINASAGTISFWWSPASPSVSILIDARDASNLNALLVYYNGSAILFSSNDADYISYTVTATANNLYHISLTYDYINDNYALYWNGVQVGTSATALTQPTMGAAIIVGSRYSKDNYWANGLIDDLCILPVALSAAEVKAIYDSNAPIQAETNTGELRLMSATANGGYVFGNANGLFGVDTSGTSTFGLTTAALNANLWGDNVSESLASGAVMMGSNKTGYANMLWDPTAKQVQLRTGVTTTVYVDGATGDAVFGIVAASKFNLLWDASEGDLQLRRNTTPYFAVDGSAGLLQFGANTTDVTQTAITVLGAAQYYNGENLGSGDMVLGNNAKEDFTVTLGGGTISESFQVGGDSYAANSNAVPVVGTYFKVTDTTDFTAGDLATAKGSAPAANDFFRVTNNGVGTEAVAYAGNAIGDQANVLWDKSAGKMYFRGGVTSQAYIDTTGAITAGVGTVVLNSSGLTVTGGLVTFISADAAVPTLVMYGHNTSGECPLRSYASQGTHASPTSSTTGDYLFTHTVYGYYTGSYYMRAQWSIIASENWTNTAQGTKQVFYTTNTGTTTIREHLWLDGDGTTICVADARIGGGLYVGATNVDPAAGTLTVTGSITSNGGLQTFGANDSGGAGYRLVRVPNV